MNRMPDVGEHDHALEKKNLESDAVLFFLPFSSRLSPKTFSLLSLVHYLSVSITPEFTEKPLVHFRNICTHQTI